MTTPDETKPPTLAIPWRTDTPLLRWTRLRIRPHSISLCTTLWPAWDDRWKYSYPRFPFSELTMNFNVTVVAVTDLVGLIFAICGVLQHTTLSMAKPCSIRSLRTKVLKSFHPSPPPRPLGIAVLYCHILNASNILLPPSPWSHKYLRCLFEWWIPSPNNVGPQISQNLDPWSLPSLLATGASKYKYRHHSITGSP